jgi:hypothetical protein
LGLLRRVAVVAVGEEGEGVVHTQGPPAGHVHPESRSLCLHVCTLSYSVLGNGVQEGGYPATATKALAYTTFTSKFKVGEKIFMLEPCALCPH